VKNTYTITAQVADRTVLADLLDAIEGYTTSVEIAVTNSAPKAAAAPAAAPVKAAPKPVRAKRNPKRSKVNDTIRESLRRGPTTVGALKDDLAAAGMSPASLSTGIAALTKSGEIERTGDGEYALKAA
jgi:hypothetical protein